MKRGDVFIIGGISGSGKGTVCNTLIERHPGLVRPVSVTTRSPRPGDRFGDHYYFVSQELFQWLVDTDQLLEYTMVWANHYYGSLKISVEQALSAGKHVLFELNNHGIDQIRRLVPSAKIVYITAPSEAEQRLRLERRGTVGEEQNERVEGASKELALAKEQGIPIIVNDDLDVAIEEIEGIFGITKSPSLKPGE